MNRGKTAAIHGNDDAESDNKQSLVSALANGRNGKIQQRAEYEKDGVGIFTSDSVGNAGPQKPPAHIEQAQKADETCRRPRADCRLFADRRF